MSALELTPQDIDQKLKAGEKLVLLDVREPEEFAIGRLEGAVLIPMQSIPAELQRVEAKADEGTLIVYCHHGVRSLQVTSWLRQQGIENCFSMTGGIARWSAEIDPRVPQY